MKMNNKKKNKKWETVTKGRQAAERIHKKQRVKFGSMLFPLYITLKDDIESWGKLWSESRLNFPTLDTTPLHKKILLWIL